MFLLSRYTVINFLKMFLATFLVLLSIVFLFDFIELLRRGSKVEGVDFFTSLSMAFFKLPDAGQEIVPFAILFASILTFWSFSKKSELLVFRNSGLSAWQFLFPSCAIAFVLGVVFLTVINPLSAAMLNRFQKLETRYLGEEKSLITISQGGLWLKQDVDQQNYIFHADKVNLENWKMDNVMILFFNDKGQYDRRLDASSAYLFDGYWQLSDVYQGNLEEQNTTLTEMKLETNITRKDIAESFTDPKLVSFWYFPEYIELLKASGINIRSIQMHYLSLLASPFLFAATTLLAASFCLKSARFQKTLFLLLFTVLTAFGLFFLSNLLTALGSSGYLPILIAAWAPGIITFMLASYIIALTEDG